MVPGCQRGWKERGRRRRRGRRRAGGVSESLPGCTQLGLDLKRRRLAFQGWKGGNADSRFSGIHALPGVRGMSQHDVCSKFQSGREGGRDVCLQSCVLIKNAGRACFRSRYGRVFLLSAVRCRVTLSSSLIWKLRSEPGVCSFPFLTTPPVHDVHLERSPRTKSNGRQTGSTLTFHSKRSNRRESEGFLECASLFWYLPIKR